MLYQALFEIPDEKVDSLDIKLASVNYIECIDDDIVPASAPADVSPYMPIDVNDLSLETLEVTKDSVIIFKYPPDTLPEEASMMKEILQEEFPDNKILGIIGDIDVLSNSPNEAVDMLNRMIAHIKIVNIQTV